MNAILKAAAGVLLGVSCLAQNTVPSESKFFKLEFTVKDVESGKLVSSRKYVTTIDTFASSQTSVRSGDKVPVHTGGNTSQFSYIDLSVNIDCNKARETPAGLSLYVSSDVTSSPV